MPFSSYEFLLAFLPLSALVVRALSTRRPRLVAPALLLLSLAFYARANPAHLLVLLPLVAVNYAAVAALGALGDDRPRLASAVLAGAIALDLCVLAAFKYAPFGAATVNAVLGLDLPLPALDLPLGVSFFTFMMITSVVDAAAGGIERRDPLRYAVFASFFPYVAAGPIVRHDEVVPQLRAGVRPTGAAAATGATLLVIGLAKKVLLAESIAPYATARFDAAAAGLALSPADAWAAALAYTAQIYFDFSGYSDMAIGAALVLGVRLPVNFASPYRAASIIEFWQRWHVTLSRLVRDYLYTPLAFRAARRGRPRPYGHLLVAMLLVGLWHGAGWTFVAWGGLHGAYLAVNHGWRALRPRRGGDVASGPVTRGAASLLTLVAVVAAWVPFRAADLATAGRVLAAMGGAARAAGRAAFADTPAALALAAALLLLTRVAPNSQQLVGYAGPGDAPPDAPAPLPLSWSPSTRWAIAVGLAVAASLVSLTRVSEFIYFRF